MSLNKLMHPRNPFFEKPPDFAELARLYPDFAKYYASNKLDFSDPEALRSLCCTLLKHLYDLDVVIPIDHLIPRVPQRINYALWIEDLLNRPQRANGIDIGCGASCIYALLICSLNKEWTMLVSDVSEQTIDYALNNVKRNHLDMRISVKKVNEKTDHLLEDLLRDTESSFDFVMCNPPFYANEQEMHGLGPQVRKPAKRPAAPHSTIRHMQLHESVFEHGGEVAFIRKLIDESFALRDRVRIYTTMLGKKSSLVELKTYLASKSSSNSSDLPSVCETQFCQGNTMRWGLAWSFSDTLKNEKKQKVKPKHDGLTFEIRPRQILNEYTPECAHKVIKHIFLNELKFELLNENANDFRLDLSVWENTWSHQRAKRRRLLKQKNSTATTANDKVMDNEKTPKDKLLDFYAQIKQSKSDNDTILILELNSNSIEMSTTREYLNQILQYICNHFKAQLN